MRPQSEPAVLPEAGVEIRVRGRVQGVGFRPAVWRLARQLELRGEVLNDPEGVLIRVAGSGDAVARLIDGLTRDPPPLARIDSIESRSGSFALARSFRIAQSLGGEANTEIAPDGVICAECADEVLDPGQRRHRYPFANCTRCGPRLSIITGVPYDRAATSMAAFEMCPACRAEHSDPLDRRFHAEAIACPHCGPTARLVRFDGSPACAEGELDAVEAACRALLAGRIVAFKGLGGYQLACDATNEGVLARLREAKRRAAKPFALMARDLDMIRRYCLLDDEAARQLTSVEGPIVLLRANGPERLPEALAPGLRTVGFMLPTTPLHLLALRRMDRPLVMTSGNLSEEPQIIDDAEAAHRLGALADCALVHDRRIVVRVDDSVVRLMGGRGRVLRRARGFAPSAIALPEGFEQAPDLLAMGTQVKSTFCLLKDGRAILSQHQGDLEDLATFDDYRRNLSLFAALFDHAPRAIAADPHPEYLASKLARERSAAERVQLVEVQHHHAHVAACLAENGRPLAMPPVLGIVLDGLGWGDDGAIWGGEFLLADYRRAERLGTFKPVAMLGGAQAAREPWRNLYAHIAAEMGWAQFALNFEELELYRYLADKPHAALDAMTRRGANAPLASSCGRLFDAVAAAIGLCRESQAYEGEAACRLEALVDERALTDGSDALAYPLTIPKLPGSGLPYVEPLSMWNALFGDLVLKTSASVMAARFHKGLAQVVVSMAKKLARDGAGEARFDTVALSGGCFQNRALFELTARGLESAGFAVLSHSRAPANDGGLALGQAAVAAARLLSDGLR